MSERRLETIHTLRKELSKGKRTVTQLAFVTGMPKHAIASCLSGMNGRREAARTKPVPGKESKWWLL